MEVTQLLTVRIGHNQYSSRPSRARTCDHLIMSQVTNFSNNPRSNHFVKLSNINGFELIATIPAIAQAMYGIYRTINYD